jgi:opacity protein-like surface antigen
MALKYACFSLMALAVLAGSPVLAQTKPLPPRPLPPAAPASTAPAYTTSGTADSAKEIVDEGAQVVPSSTAPGRLGVTPAPQPAPQPYRVTTAPRNPKTGWSFSVFGGANVSQSGEDAELGANPIDLSSQVMPVGGIKVGYTWPFDSEPMDQLDAEFPGGVHLGGGVEFEGFYLGEKLNISRTGVEDEVDADNGVLSANFLLKAQYRKFRAYAGPGFGLAYIAMSGNDTALALGQDDSEDAVIFVWQVLAGLDYFITPDWSIFGEYKYFNFYDYDFYSGPAQISVQDFENHLLNFGVRYHF